MRQLCAIAIGAILLAACAGGGGNEEDLNAGVSDFGSTSGGESTGGQFNAPFGGATGAPVETPQPTINVYVRFDDQIRTDLQAAGIPADKIDCVNEIVATQLRAADRSGALSDGPDLTIRSYYRSAEMERVFIGCEVDLAVVDRLPSG